MKFVIAPTGSEMEVELVENHDSVQVYVDGVVVATFGGGDAPQLVIDGSNVKAKGMSYQFVPPVFNVVDQS